MEHEKKTMYLLYAIAFLLSSSWGVSYFRDKQSFITTHLDVASSLVENDMQNLSAQQVQEYISSLLYSGNIELIARILCQLPVVTTRTIIQDLINTKTTLSMEENIELLFAIASCYKSIADKHSIFQFFITHPKLHANVPVLFVCARSAYAKNVLSLFLTWAKKQAVLLDTLDKKNFIQALATHAILYAIEQNDIKTTSLLIQEQLPISNEFILTALTKVIQKYRSPEFISLLIKEFGIPVDSVFQRKWTLVMYAAEVGNKAAVQTLINLGADVHRIVVPKIGSALSIAIENKETEIELLLRAYGARE